MKNTIFALAVLGTVAGQSQNIKENEVPADIKNKFNMMYPHAENPKWEKEKANYEVEFQAKGKSGKKEERSAVMDAQGNFIHEEVEIESSELPSVIHDYLKNALGKKRIQEACRINLPNGETNYEVQIGKTDYIFDSSGNFLKEEQASGKNSDKSIK